MLATKSRVSSRAGVATQLALFEFEPVLRARSRRLHRTIVPAEQLSLPFDEPRLAPVDRLSVLAMRAQRDLSLEGSVIREIEPLIQKLLARVELRRHGVYFSELRHIAQLGALKAVRTYQSERGPFLAWAKLLVYQTIVDEIRKVTSGRPSTELGESIESPRASLAEDIDDRLLPILAAYRTVAHLPVSQRRWLMQLPESVLDNLDAYLVGHE